MSVLGLIDQSQVDPGVGGIQAQPTTFSDVVDASISSMARNYSVVSEDVFTGLERNDRDKKYRELTGRDLYMDAFEASPDAKKLIEKKRMAAGLDNDQIAAVDSYIERLRIADPEKFKDIKNSLSIKEAVKQKAKDAYNKNAEVTAGATTAAAIGGQLTGGLIAGFMDPVNLLTIPLGAGMTAGIIKTAIIEAGINVGAEVVAAPFISKWQKQLGQDYGLKEFGENAMYAAGFGALFGGGARAAKVGLDKMRMSNAAIVSEIRKVSDDIEVQEALRHDERMIHIDESNPARYDESVDPELHTKALEEVDAAINEGRRIDFGDDARALDEALDGLNTDKITGGEGKILDELQSKPPKERIEEDGIDADKPNEIVADERTETPTKEQFEETKELLDSPEVHAAERQEFEQAFMEEGAEDFTFYDVDDNGNSIEMTAKELKEMMAEDKNYLSVISTCGLKVTE